MARIEGFRIKNFKVLQDVTLGRLWNRQQADPLSPLTAVIGKNGVGKSNLFDAFGFLADCSKLGVEEACDARGRGGFERILSRGKEGPIEFVVYYKESGNSRPITYELSVDLDDTGRPYVSKERLRQRRIGEKYGQPLSFLALNDGKGIAWKGDQGGLAMNEEQESGNLTSAQIKESRGAGEEPKDTEDVELSDNRELGITTLGSLKQYPRISAFRKFIQSWHLSYFTPDAARSLPLAGPQKHLNAHGDNLGNVVQFMEREHPGKFQYILDRIAKKIPGIDKIDTEKTKDNRILLRFSDKGFDDPFYAQQMSDGTLKIFTYLLMLEHPEPPPFLCIEEPENGLYHKLLETLAQEFREHATGHGSRSQIFVTTHQPYFVNALEPEEVWVLEKNASGFSDVKRASDDETVKNMVSERLPLGGLWYSDYLDAR